jgi:phosphatidate cytidylyltransferase
MPFNWQTFRTRALSSVVFVVIMLVGLLWNHWSFFVLFSVIHFGCWIEYQKLVEKIDPDYKKISAVHRYGVMLTGWGFMLWMTSPIYRISDVKMSDIGFWMMVAGAIAVNMETIISRRGKLIAHSLMGLLYISLSLGLIIKLADFYVSYFAYPPPYAEGPPPYSIFPIVPILIIVSMWINDTMAYIVGSLIGKTPFSKISPKKTWEGTIGGIILCVLVVGFIGSNTVIEIADYRTQLGTLDYYFIPAIAAIFGTVGDLFESKLKRLAGVKDSGQMMPGHGGFLDRFDSLLLAVPFVWLYIWLFVGR